jgi:hypothetical protein
MPPLPPAASAAANTRCLYSAVNVRRLASTTTSGSGRVGLPAARGAPQRGTVSRGRSSEPFLDEAPPRFHGVEVAPVRRQVVHARAARRDPPFDPAVFVRPQVVHHHDIPRPQFRRQAPTHPGDEPVGGGGMPPRAHRDPARGANRADQGQVVAPVAGPRAPKWGSRYAPLFHGSPGSSSISRRETGGASAAGSHV